MENTTFENWQQNGLRKNKIAINKIKTNNKILLNFM